MKQTAYFKELVQLVVVLLLISNHCLAAPKKLELGAVLALTGMASSHGTAIKNGLELARNDLIKDGWEVSVAYEDDGTEPKRSVGAFQSLASKGIRFIFGPTWSFQIGSVVPLLSRLDVVALCPAGSMDIVGSTHSNIFFGMTPNKHKRDVITEWIKNKKIKRFAIVYANSSWGDLHDKILKEAAKNAGLEADVYNFEYGSEDTAIKTIVAKLKNNGTDGAFYTSSKEGSSMFVRRAVEQHLSLQILGPDEIIDAKESGLFPKLPPEIQLYDVSEPFPTEFFKRYSEKFPSAPRMYAAHAYDLVMALAKAVESTDGSVKEVSKALHEIQFQGATGEVSFDKNGDRKITAYEVKEIS